MAKRYCNLLRDLNQKYLLNFYEGTVLGMGRFWHVEVSTLLYSNDISLRIPFDKTIQSTKSLSNLSLPGSSSFAPLPRWLR